MIQSIYRSVHLVGCLLVVNSSPNIDYHECLFDPDLPHCRNGVEQSTANTKRPSHRDILFNRLEIVRNVKQSDDRPRAIYHDSPLTEEERQIVMKFTSDLDRFRRNNVTEDPHIDADLREKEFGGSGDNNEEELLEFVSSRGDHHEEKGRQEENGEKNGEDTEEIPRGQIEKYCNEYEQHFSFYCVGEQGDHKGDEERIAKFCPSYESACPHKQITKSSDLTIWPSDPFTKEVKIPLTKEPESDEEDDSEEEISSAEDVQQRFEALMGELKRRIPCTPTCDRRVYPHCTDECKCDYIYPAVQHFCNPPPLPLFLNTCRLWYHFCPKYHQYHYASQYIYSKAEKGKSWPGPQPSNPNPFNIPSPAGVPHVGTPSRVAGLRTRSGTGKRRDRLKLGSGLKSTKKKKSAKRAPKRKTRKSQPVKRLSTRELFRTLKAINSLTAQPLTVSNDRDTPSSGSVLPHTSELRPRAYQATKPSVVSPDRQQFEDDTFRAFYYATDTHGIYHRPRSRGPWTKPGLWEANPDNPHNRDHANKWWYRPYSVTADWLNGQVTWGAHFAVPAAGVGGSDGYSALFFPSVGTFLNIPDDYD
ncbi:hypothetical protein Q1695_016111 [Nippostrongylus brasiliensis]|nr:hypothetical protein Q1695_016111 [Nippostrongylus brasiliensis]